MALAADIVFLVLYPVLGLVFLGVAAHLVTTWPTPGRDWLDGVDFTGEEIGELANGPVRSVEAAVARLRVSGALAYDPARRKLVCTSRRDDVTPLSAAVLDAVADGTAAAAIVDAPGVKAALDRQRSHLEQLRGEHCAAATWRHSDLPRGRRAAAICPPVTFAVVGLAWAAVGPYRWFTDVPLGLLAIVVGVLGVLLAGSLPTITDRAVDRLQTGNGHLHPDMHPALATYGPADAALAVGLHGMTVLESTDRALAGVSLRPVVTVPTYVRTPGTRRVSGGGGDGGCAGCGGG
jgi:uncharacterized protein (TIGR04222 family)